MPRRADSGGLSDRGRGADRRGGAHPAPRADAPAASGSLWSFCRATAVTVYWWNPFVWLAAFVSGRDAELACDEAVAVKLSRRSVWPTRAPFWRRPRARRPR
ncbi:MAG: M56 family metallopeptidase [Oscillospiraceae bacterium]